MSSTLSRRGFLKRSGMLAALAALAACGPRPPAAQPSTSTPTKITRLPSNTPASSIQLSRALRRILFAPTPDDLARAEQIGLDAFIEEQLAPDTISDAGLADRLAGYQTLSMGPGELAQRNQADKPWLQLIQATLVRAVYSRRQLYELMVDFWSNHFNIYVGKHKDSYLKTVDDREVIRPHALGKFSDLLSASAHSPAMLVYLDNALSNKTNPNENYGRELLELHTISVDGGYTQADVREAARALTGWTISTEKNGQAGLFFYNPRLHDDAEKTILGQHFPAGQGIKDGEQLLEMLAGHPSTARFIAAKLVRRFVSDDPPATLIAQAADTFTKTGGDIAKVMGTILHSDAFKASLGQKIKRPFEFVVSALRVTGADIQPDQPTINVLRQLGQAPFYWESPNGYPDAAGAWITTNGMLRRWNYALALATNALKDTHLDLARLIDNASSAPAGMLDALSLRLLGEPLAANERHILLNFIESGANSNDFNQLMPALTALILCTIDFQYR